MVEPLRDTAGAPMFLQMEPPYLIRPVASADLALLSDWRSRPHVSRWWGDPAIEPEAEKLRDNRVAMWIGESARGPLAFLQDYDIGAWLPYPFDYLPTGSRGMDVYIGETAMLGAGHGSRLVRQHVDQLFRDAVPAVGIDPHPENIVALRAFNKAGFAVACGPVETRWGWAVLMDRHAAVDHGEMA